MRIYYVYLFDKMATIHFFISFIKKSKLLIHFFISFIKKERETRSLILKLIELYISYNKLWII